MVDLELVTAADGREHRGDDILGHVLDALAARADQVVVVLGVASDVRGYVTFALESTRHPVFDLLLERAIDGGAADRWVRRPYALVELLR